MEYKKLLKSLPIPYLTVKLHEISSDYYLFIIEDFSESLTELKNIKYGVKGKNIEEVFNINIDLGLSKSILDEENIDMYIPKLKRTYRLSPCKLTNDTYILWMIDISKEIDSEEAQINKTDFFTNLSHELRTPLNIIFSSLQVLNLKIESIKDISCQESISKYTNIAIQNTYRLLKLVNNLIDSNKITSGYFEFNPQSYDIILFIENICQSIVEFAKTKNIEIIFDTEVEEKIMLFDLDKMERIILNLLSNAIKFSKDGDKIDIFIREIDEIIEIKISDEGIGIPENKLNCIFDRFKQVDNKHVRKGEGSGIGLYLVKSLVDMHNGDVYVESKLGKGSTFTIKIPIKYGIEENDLIILDKKINESYVEKIKVEFSDIYV